MKVPTIFFGSSSYVLPLLEMLQKDYDLKLVITTEQKPSDAVPAFCKEKTIPFLSLKSFKTPEWQEAKEHIKEWNLQFAVLADFGLILPQSVLDLFPKGIINIHPSFLPEYRGPTPGVCALLDGKTITGVSIMLLDKEVDHGPLLGQKTYPVSPADTAQSLYERLFAEGTVLLEQLLPLYIDGDLVPLPQDHTKATYTTRHLVRESGFIAWKDLSEIEKEILDRKIRAYFPWPGVWTKVEDPSCRLNGKIIKLLPENHLQVEGKKPMSTKDFLNGYPEMKEWVEKLS